MRRFPAKKKKVFEEWIEDHRRIPLKALQHGLESQRYRDFERHLVRFLEGQLPAHPRAAHAVKLVRDIAPIVITEKYDAVIEQGISRSRKPETERISPSQDSDEETPLCL